MDSEMASCKSSGTYINEVPPPGANIVDGMWIFTVKRPPGSPPAFKPSAASLWSLPGEWHDTLRMTLAALGFSPSSADPSLFLRTDTSRLPIYVLVSFSASASSSLRHSTLLCLLATRSQLHLRTSPYSRVARIQSLWVSLMYLMTCTRLDLTYPLSLLARYVAPGHSDVSCADDRATQHSSQGYTFSLGSDSVSWRSTCSSSVLGSSCEAKIFAGGCTGATLPGLEEQPRSPPVFYVDNKAMLALCHEQRLEHRTKHIPRQKTRRGF
ncbi:unnamed protein product [Closterium sp. NIES-54]